MSRRRKLKHRLIPSSLTQKKLVVGWNEYVDLTDFRIRGLRAKIDTGAESSALHVENIIRLPNRFVAFQVVLSKKKPRRKIRIVTKIFRTAYVRSSIGVGTKRLFIRTRIRLGPVERKVEVSLVDRQKMEFRMLIGKSTLSGHFLVDVTHGCILTHKKRKIVLRK